MTEALQAASLLIAVLAWLCIALPHLSPCGWQDDGGFHVGEPDQAASFNSFHSEDNIHV